MTTELELRNLTVTSFKARFPRLYTKIVQLYGGRTNIFDINAAICLFLRNETAPVCCICNTPCTITKKFRVPGVIARCKAHINTRNVISLAELKAANEHNYTIVAVPDYIVASSTIVVNCSIHGDYTVGAGYFISGGKCQQCYHAIPRPVIDMNMWVDRSTTVHNGRYDYSNSQFTSLEGDVTYKCPVHNNVTQNAGVHMRGHGCRLCASSLQSKNYRLTTSEFINKAIAQHGLVYDYSLVTYTDSRTPVTVICSVHGKFEQVAYYHLAGNGCPVCGIAKTTFKSQPEYDIIEFLTEHGIDNIIHSDRHLGFELDIYLPDYQLAIEYNGVYWHSSGDTSTDKIRSTQHLFKTNQCELAGIQLLHILDIEWNSQRDIWKSTILHKLGKTSNVVAARKCNVVEIPNATAMQFFRENHLQGAVSGMISIGLKHNGELVSVGMFSKSRFRKSSECYELLRFATKCNTLVVGGFSKVICKFKKQYTGTLVSYANRRWSVGNVYNQCGFALVKTSSPCYYYTNGKQLWHRSSFQKHLLNGILDTFNSNLTESENMYANGYRRIWDSGHLVYELTIRGDYEI